LRGAAHRKTAARRLSCTACAAASGLTRCDGGRHFCTDPEQAKAVKCRLHQFKTTASNVVRR
jgi:hypothetical protein